MTICYNGQSATDKQAERMAEQECGKFAKQARAIDETFGECPLMTPIEARFACVAKTR